MSDYFDSYAINQNIVGDARLAVNQIPVGLLDFALISNLRHKAYGVNVYGTEEDQCAQCCLNDHARQSIWRILFSIQQNIMAKKKITAGPAYFQENILIDHNATTVQTGFGAIEKVDVKPQFNFLVNLYLSPFIVNDVTVQDNSGTPEILFNSTIVGDPERVIPRDSENYAQFPWSRLGGNYPVKDGYDWVMPCTNLTSDYLDGTKTVSLQHYDYMIAETEVISGVNLSDLVVFHPNTYQILPFAKEPEEVVSDGVLKWRFWFYAWTLTKPEFDGNPPDLVKGEFYKLYDLLELYEKTEIEAESTIYIRSYKNHCDITTEVKAQAGSTEIIDSFSGMVRFQEDVNSIYGRRFKFGLYYKVNPLTYEHIFQHSTEELKRAIVAKAAATINLDDCGCAWPSGDERGDYITQMQKHYTKEYVSPVTGAVAINYMYGNKHGDMLFAEMMNKITFRPKVYMI